MNKLSIGFGNKLKTLRLQRGFTITELATKSGVTQGYISKLESGAKQEPSWKVVQALADALVIPVDDFRNGTKFPLYSIMDHLPKDLQDFVLSQKNIHYIELAKDCVELDLSPEALKLYINALAEVKALSENVKK